MLDPSTVIPEVQVQLAFMLEGGWPGGLKALLDEQENRDPDRCTYSPTTEVKIQEHTICYTFYYLHNLGHKTFVFEVVMTPLFRGPLRTESYPFQLLVRKASLALKPP